MLSLRRACTLLCASIAVACSDSDRAPTGSGHLVQIAEVRVEPRTANCTEPHLPDTSQLWYDLTYFVQMVNTTDAEVTVTNVSSSGVIIRSTREADLGKPAHMFASLPFSPEAPLIRARDGNITFTVTMRVLCGAVVIGSYDQDILTTLRVTTTSGQYTSTPVTFRVGWS